MHECDGLQSKRQTDIYVGFFSAIAWFVQSVVGRMIDCDKLLPNMVDMLYGSGLSVIYFLQNLSVQNSNCNPPWRQSIIFTDIEFFLNFLKAGNNEWFIHGQWALNVTQKASSM